MKEYIIKQDSNFIFDEKKWILDKKLNKRIVVFFDLNHWINLLENQKSNNIYKEMLSTLIDLLVVKKIECCTSVAQAIEIGKINNFDDRKVLAYFIDKMTNGLSIRHPQQLIELELFFINKIGTKAGSMSITENEARGFAFTHLMNALGNGNFSLSFADLNIEENVQWDMTNTIFESIIFSPTYLIANSVDKHMDNLHTAIDESFKKALLPSENIKKYQDTLYQEMEGNKEILKVIVDRNPEYYKTFTNFDFNSSQNSKMLPSLNALSKLYSAFCSSGKKFSNNDFYDLMNASVILPYVDIYATDKFVKQLATTNPVKLSEEYKTVVLSKDEEILAELKKIKGS